MGNEMFNSYFSGLVLVINISDPIIIWLSTFHHLTQDIKMREIAIS